MNTAEKNELIKYFTGEAAPEDKEVWALFLALNKEDDAVEKCLEAAYKKVWETAEMQEPEYADSAWAQFMMLAGISPAIIQRGPVRMKWLRYGIVASFFFLASLLGWKLLLQPGKAPAPQWAELYAPLGKIKRVTLPDSTVVYLNAGSCLRYQKNRMDIQRQVRLEGEAFFNVSHNPQKPFVVTTAHTITRVLGTRFNVEAYSEEDHTKIGLVQGCVETGSAQRKVLLVPGKMMVYENESGAEKIITMDTTQQDWVNGALIYNDLPLTDVLQRISKAYNVPVILGDAIVPGYRITGRFPHGNIETVLNGLLAVHRLKWRKYGNGYQIYK